MLKNKFTFILAASLFLGSSLSAFASEVELESPKEKQMILQLDQPLAWIDGLEYTLTDRPKVLEGRTYLPLRFVADMLLEAGIDWEPASKKVTLMKDEKKVEVRINQKEAFINGDLVEMENPPIIVDSLTYLPLRAIAELYEIQVGYDEATRRVTLIKANTEPATRKPAMAQFSFVQEDYTAGQIVQALDESFHEDGIAITDRLWMIDFDDSKTNKKLENIFSKPREGHYLVSLKVQAGKGNWSEWTTREITIKPNQKPLVTSLNPTKAMYDGGELMDLTYTYENEPWEEIKSVRWTYRQVGEPMSKTVVKKPQYIFHEGQYIVTLELEDDYGNKSLVAETIVNISSKILQSELEYRFKKGEPGDIIDNFNNFNYLNYRSVDPNETSLKEGVLLISNSPENVRSNGILYSDTVKGMGRILLHHHNSFTEEENTLEAKKLVLVAENPGDEPVSLSLSNRVEKGPSEDILFVGQQVLLDYLKGSETKTYILNPGEKKYIYDSGSKKWDKGKLISVQMDFNASGKLRLTTAAMGRTSSIDDIQSLTGLAKDAHPRGTFQHTGIHHKIHVDPSQPTKLILGEGSQEWVDGYDGITGEIVQNRGNYAVNYKLEITAIQDTGIMLNPRAGEFRGALKWDQDQPFLAPSKGYIMGHNSKGIMLGIVKAGETRSLQYSLPNGSASPVLLVFMPESYWNN